MGIREKIMRILLADDEMNVRSALRLLLEQESGVSVVGEATSYPELFKQVRDINPDLVLLDWELPGEHTGEALADFNKANPGVRVVVLSSQPEARKKALSAGATAFVSKEEPPERLLTIIDSCQKHGVCRAN